MKSTRKPSANLRSWCVILIRSKGEYLGSVEAPDRERAEAVAVKQFDLDQDQRRRLLIRELRLTHLTSNAPRPFALPRSGMPTILTWRRMVPLSAASSRPTPRP